MTWQADTYSYGMFDTSTRLSRLSYGSLGHFYLSNAQLSEAALDFKSSSTLSIGLLQPELKVCCRLALLLTDLIKRERSDMLHCLR
jgi:hypothetical protein